MSNNVLAPELIITKVIFNKKTRYLVELRAGDTVTTTEALGYIEVDEPSKSAQRSVMMLSAYTEGPTGYRLIATSRITLTSVKAMAMLLLQDVLTVTEKF